MVLSATAVWLWIRSRSDEPARRASVERHGGANERRILVIANETVGGQELLAILRRKAAEECPVGCSSSVLRSIRRCGTWASDEDGARAAAQSRLDASLGQLARDGIEAEGEVGDGDLLQAIEDALRTFGADEIVISTHPEGRSHWLERDVVGAARERFAVPITHVVVDLEAHAELARARSGRVTSCWRRRSRLPLRSAPPSSRP